MNINEDLGKLAGLKPETNAMVGLAVLQRIAMAQAKRQDQAQIDYAVDGGILREGASRRK